MSERWRPLGLLLLRLAGVYLALGHGWGKLSGLASGGSERFVATLGQLGFPAPVVFAWLAALSETVGGLLVALGLFTRVAAAFAAITVGVATFVRHHALEQWWSALRGQELSEETRRAWGSPEMAFLFFLIMSALVVLGAGRWSLDARLRKKS